MPIDFDLHDGVVFSRAHGVLTTECLDGHRQSLAETLGSQPDRELLDLRAVEQIDLTGGAVRAEVSTDRVQLESSETPADPKLALVADREVLYGIARMYQILHEGSGLTIEIFRSMEDARQWIQGLSVEDG